MGMLGWIGIGLALGVIGGAIYGTPLPGGRAPLYLMAVAGGLLGGLLGTAASGASIATFFALTPWVVAVVGALAFIGLYGLAAGASRASQHEQEAHPWTR